MRAGDKVQSRVTGETGTVSHIDGDNLYLVEAAPNVRSAREFYVCERASDKEHHAAVDSHPERWNA